MLRPEATQYRVRPAIRLNLPIENARGFADSLDESDPYALMVKRAIERDLREAGQ